MFIKDDAESQKSQIMKKYNDNLVVTNTAVDLSGLTTIEVGDFKEMLKLSTWLNKPIIYCTNSPDADFVIAADGFAYTHSIITNFEGLPLIEEVEEIEDSPAFVTEVESQAIHFDEHLKKENDLDQYIPKRARPADVLGIDSEEEEKTIEIIKPVLSVTDDEEIEEEYEPIIIEKPKNIFGFSFRKTEPQDDYDEIEYEESEFEEEFEEASIATQPMKRTRFGYSKLG